LIVEGPRDEDFLNSVVKPRLKGNPLFVKVYKFSRNGERSITRFLAGLDPAKTDYLCFVDLDKSPCATAKKGNLLSSVPGLDPARVVVVKKVIEGWYLAGLDDRNCRRLGLRPFGGTENVSKDDFEKMMPNRFKSLVDFRNELLKCHSLPHARARNRSFDYLVRRFLI